VLNLPLMGRLGSGKELAAGGYHFVVFMRKDGKKSERPENMIQGSRDQHSSEARCSEKASLTASSATLRSDEELEKKGGWD